MPFDSVQTSVETIETIEKKKKKKPKKTSELPTLVFKYGLPGAPVEGFEQVEDQLFRGHRYYNDLTSMTCGEVAAKKALQLQTPVGPQLAGAEARVVALYKERDGIRNAIAAERQEQRKTTPVSSENRRRLVELDGEISEAQEVRTGWRKKANLDPAYKAQVDKMFSMRKDLINVNPETPGMAPGVRKQCGLYPGTYLFAENAANAAYKHAMKFWAAPKYHRWEGNGAVAVQVKDKGGIPVSALFSGEDTRMHIINEPRTRVTRKHPEGIKIPHSCWFRLRVGSTPKGRAIWAKWPMIMHRPLPDDAIVKWATVIRSRVGRKVTWAVHFTLEAKSFAPAKFDTDAALGVAHLPKEGAPPVAVHLHPMAVTDDDGNLLVAMAMNSVGETTPCFLSMVDRRKSPNGKKSSQTFRIQDVKGAQEHANGLRSQRDTNFNEIRHTLRAEMNVRDVPEWLSEALRYMAQWEQQLKLVKVAHRWSRERFDGDESMYGALDAWRRQDTHLYQWESCERERAIRHRRDIYRNWARRLANEHKGMLVLENVNFANLARRPNPEDEDLLNDRLRARRPTVAVGELREALKHAFFGRVTVLEPEGRAALCPICGGKLQGAADSRECKKCDVLPVAWFSRCWQLLRDAGHPVEEIAKKWKSDAQMLRQVVQLKEGVW
jgi:hypothetical protein